MNDNHVALPREEGPGQMRQQGESMDKGQEVRGSIAEERSSQGSK